MRRSRRTKREFTRFPYDLKAVIYLWHFKRKQVIKLICGGSGRSEWFEYTRNKPSGDPGILSTPWRTSFPTAQLLSQIKTVFASTASKTDKGLEYHRLSFSAAGMCNDEELKEVFEVEAKIKAWVDGWAKVNANRKEDGKKPLPPSTSISGSTTGPGAHASRGCCWCDGEPGRRGD